MLNIAEYINKEGIDDYFNKHWDEKLLKTNNIILKITTFAIIALSLFDIFFNFNTLTMYGSSFRLESLFIILIAVIYLLYLKDNQKYFKINLVLLFFAGIYVVLVLLNQIGLINFFNIFYIGKYDLYIPIIILLVNSLLYVLNKHVTLNLFLSIVGLCLGFFNFTNYLGQEVMVSEIIIFNLSVFVLFYISLFINPKEGNTKYLFLDTRSSRFGFNVLVFSIIIFSIYASLLIYLQHFITIPLQRGVLITSGALIVIFIVSFTFSGVASKKFYSEQQSHSKATKMENFYKNLITLIAEGVIVTDKNHKIIYVNDAVLNYFGENEEDVIGKSICDAENNFSRISYEYQQAINSLTPRFIKSKEIKRSKDSSENIFISGWISPNIENNQFKGTTTTLINITSSEEFESGIKAAILEKNILLTESTNRVKSNLNILLGLINLQLKNIEDNETRIKILDAKSRIEAIGLIYNKPFIGTAKELISINRYLTILTKMIKSRNLNFVFELDVANIFIDKDKLVSLGLIVNEAILNFTEPLNLSKNKIIKISFFKDMEGYILKIENENNFEFNNDIDTDLITVLAMQIDGEIEFDNANVIIKFKNLD